MYNEHPVAARWLAEMYDREETQTEDVLFLLESLGRTKRRVLEIACGSGRILIPLAQAGHDATGLDFDESMLARLSARSAGIPNLQWRHADAMTGDWGKGYDAVLLMGNFLFNITMEGDYCAAQRLMLTKAYDALLPGGSLYIDYGYTLHPESWFDDPAPRVIFEGTDSDGNSGRMLLRDSAYHPDTRTVTFNRVFEIDCPDGTAIRETIPSVKHYMSREELLQWLADAGFSIAEEYGDYDRKPVGEDTGRLIIRAVKSSDDIGGAL